MIGEIYLRREIGRTLGVPIGDDAWDWLLAQGDIARVLKGRARIIDVIAKLRKTLRAFRHLQPPTFEVLPFFEPLREQDAEYSRHKVLSLLAARDADGDIEISQFRYRELPAGPLKESAIEGWIFARFRKDARSDDPTWWLAGVPMPGTVINQVLRSPTSRTMSVGSLVTAMPISATEVLEMASWRLLAYGVPTSTHWQMEERAIPIVAGGALDHLRRVSVRLAQQYGWTEAEATTFVLTRWVPVRRPITVWTEQNEHLPGLSVIHLTADPGLSPREVGDAYLEERRRLLGTRYRDLSEKHLTLALFVASERAEQTWAERLETWNSLYADRGWGYTQVANFSHDCLQAQRRLLRSEEPIVGPTEGTGRLQSPSPEERPDKAGEARYVEAWA